MYSQLGLRLRLVAVLIYLLSLVVISGLATGTWFPDGTGKSLWLLAAIGMVLFTRLTAPFFATPRDSLANSATAALLLATVDLHNVSALKLPLNAFRWAAVAFSLVVVASSVTSIALYRGNSQVAPWKGVISKIAYRLSERLGNGPLVFTPLALISIAGFWQTRPLVQTALLVVWAVLVFIQPIDLILRINADIREILSGRQRGEPVGEIQRVDDPGILRVRLFTSRTWGQDCTHVAQLPDSRQVEVVPLFVQTQGSELIGTGLYHENITDAVPGLAVGQVCCASNLRSPDEILGEFAGSGGEAKLIGFVVENSTIDTVRFEVSASHRLEEGWLVFTCVDNERVYYQILDARTNEEAFHQNPRGTHIVLAQQLGSLSTGKRFKRCGWLPRMNAPVFLLAGDPEEASPDEAPSGSFRLGTVPNSGIPVVAVLDDLLEYHSAILGATGTGKTELAYDIVRAAYAAGVKTVCVDFTGEYQARLADLDPVQLGLDTKQGETLQERLFDVEVGEYSAGDEKKALKEFVDEIRPGIESQVHDFLEADGSSIGIFELEEIANTKATLRATELYLSTIFSWARKNRTEKRILLVLEEAHTVVPEANLFGHDRVETNSVVGRMAQIALQGRKYGVGLMLISQRTALVSKTLLSQCNTVLCFAMHDETGLKYMGNVFNTERVSSIPNLRFLQGIAFGKGIQSDSPIVFEVAFDKEKQNESLKLRTGETSEPQEVSSEAEADAENDIPF